MAPTSDSPDSSPQRPRHAHAGRSAKGAKAGTRNSSTTRSKRAARSPRQAPAPLTAEQIEARRASVPAITYADLPISARRADIAQAIEGSQVVIVAGETGSGKTTQLPKICLELGRGVTGMIGHTQPRRIAARATAERIAAELGTTGTPLIGYQVRFTDETNDRTLVKVMTDGILLAEIQSDPLLTRYDTLIIDEAHERSLNIDFLLGYLAQLLPRRPELKLIITSATIDTERFAAHFGPLMAGGTPGALAPVIEVSGRTYPVEVRYRPLDSEDSSDAMAGNASPTPTRRATHAPATPGRAGARDQVTGILEAAAELMHEGPGDILVFLSGEGEIRDTQAAFIGDLGPRYLPPGAKPTRDDAVEIVPLYARLSAAEQHRIFATHSHRRIILATNIAETSLTVPGIHYVIDAGTARISRYSAKTKVQRLPIEPVSQASANQRAGRCGRTAGGICIRLYSDEDFASREEFTQPEILRTSLASVIIHMLSLGLGDIASFPFLDPPEAQAIRAGMQLLDEIGAIRPARSRGANGTGAPQLTSLGRKLARLPLDPRLGRMLIEAERNGCASEVLVIVAALSVQDVRERPAERRSEADALHARFTASHSDFLAYLTLWRYLRTQQRELSGSAFRRMCRSEFLNYLRWREWVDVARQLEQMARPLGLHIRPLALPTPAQLGTTIRPPSMPSGGSPQSALVAAACRDVGRSDDTPSADAIHMALLPGLLSNLGAYSDRTRDYEGARGTHFVIWPGSGLHRRTPEWVMAAELVETSRLFARTVAAIDGAWVEKAAARLVRRSYSEAYWSRRHGAAMCREKVTLYGMVLAADRPVPLAKVGGEAGRALARQMFIEHALVRGQWRGRHAFLERNAQAIADAEETVQRLRRHGLVADEEAQAAFYDERLPASITSAGHFEGWWRREQAAGRGDSLDFTQEFLLGPVQAEASDYPDVWRQGSLELPLTYSFNPGSYGDGVTVEIPAAALAGLQPAGFDWLVPGMRSELVLTMIRALPKRVRRQLVPAPDTARELEPVIAHLEQQAREAASTGGGNVALHDTAPSTLTFREAFTQAVREVRGVDVTGEDWAQAQIPEHAQMHFRVLSPRGAVLEESTSLENLQASLAPQAQEAVGAAVRGAVAQALAEARSSARGEGGAQSHGGEGTSAGESESAKRERTERERHEALAAVLAEYAGSEAAAMHAFPSTPLPQEVTAEAPSGTVIGYPALACTEEEGSPHVTLRIFTSAGEAAAEHVGGVCELAYLRLALDPGRITSRWAGDEALDVAGAPYANTEALVADLQRAAARVICDSWAADTGTALAQVRAAEDFEAICAWGRDRFEDEVYRQAKLVARICREYAQVRAALADCTSIALLATVADEKAHCEALVYEGFVRRIPPQQLTHLPRYMQAVAMRLAKAAQNPAADDFLAWQVQQVAAQVADAQAAAAAAPFDAERAARIERAQWMVEEFRVSLFAQQLGTNGKVSAKRIAKALAQS